MQDKATTVFIVYCTCIDIATAVFDLKFGNPEWQLASSLLLLLLIVLCLLAWARVWVQGEHSAPESVVWHVPPPAVDLIRFVVLMMERSTRGRFAVSYEYIT